MSTVADLREGGWAYPDNKARGMVLHYFFGKGSLCQQYKRPKREGIVFETTEPLKRSCGACQSKLRNPIAMADVRNSGKIYRIRNVARNRPAIKIVAGIPMVNQGYGSYSWEIKIEVWEARDETGDWMWMTGFGSHAEGKSGSMEGAVLAALNRIKKERKYIDNK